MRTIDNRAEDAVLNGLNVFLGLILFLAPWYLELANESAAALNAYACGGAIAVVGMLALSKSYDWEEYLNLTIGIWAALAPWLLGFADAPLATAAHVVVGLAVAALAGVELRRLYRSPEAYSV
jgi:hypothetical protein